MWTNIIIGSTLILITTIIHSMATLAILHYIKKHINLGNLDNNFHRTIWLLGIVLIMFSVTISESALWSYAYVFFDAITTFEEALYFSIVTFTTLGFGDIILSDEWRILGSLEAANGIIIFGWTTAIIMATVQKLYLTER